MPWFVIDDSAHSHPKIIAATNAAFGLWVRCGSYAAQHLTDGVVYAHVAKMYGTRAQIAKLIAAGLWHEHGHTCPHPKCKQPAPGDYYMHDYLAPYNPSRAEVNARREREAEKKRKYRAEQEARANHGQGRAGSRADQTLFDDDPHTNSTPDEGDSAGRGDTSPGDSRGTRAGASPSPPRPSQGGPERALSAITPDWQPSDADIEAAQLARADAGREQLTPQQLAAVTQKFVQRMTDDGTRAVGFGGRWRTWAERERPEPPTSGDVIPFNRRAPQQSTNDMFGAALQRARARMNEGGR